MLTPEISVAPCACGRSHALPIETLIVGENALDDLGAWIGAHRYKTVLLLDDDQTGPVLGERVASHLAHEGFQVIRHCFYGSGHLRADQSALREGSRALTESGADLALAVGSGTLTDIARSVSFSAGIPFAVMATAPSVDGYASTVAALQLDGVKVTKSAQAPLAIFALPSILTDAPWPMIQSGFGDLIGKMTALMDWKLARLAYHESWCDAAYLLMSETLTQLVALTPALVQRDPVAVAQLFQGLVHSGLAMALMGNSRPASGAEHHLSHYWDFATYQGRRPYLAHGLQVGYATQVILAVYQTLEHWDECRIPEWPILDSAWEEDIRRRWGDGADDILREQRAKYAGLVGQTDADRFTRLTGSQIRHALEPEWSQRATVQQALSLMGFAPAFDAWAVSPTLLAETLTYARELRARYTILDFLAGQHALTPTIDDLLARQPGPFA